MRIPRFFASGRDLQALKALLAEGCQSASVSLAEEDLIKQIRVVLRLQKGYKIQLLDDAAHVFELELSNLEKARVDCRVLEIVKGPEIWRQSVLVGLAMIKADRFEWCLEKLSELGVTEVTPVSTRNCVVKMQAPEKDAKGSAPDSSSRLGGKLKRWQSIAREAAEQSERSTIPRVVSPLEFAEFIHRPAKDDQKALRFICVERSQSAPLVKALSDRISSRGGQCSEGIDSVSLLIGPEGGFTEWEISAAEEQGWTPVTLGPRILRSETASIVAMAQVASVLDIAE